MNIKFPHIEVELVGHDGEAFGIIERISKAMRAGGCTLDEIQEFQHEATAGDYDHFLQTCIETVEVT